LATELQNPYQRQFIPTRPEVKGKRRPERKERREEGEASS
jgi:hypothetical protein